jgi:VanZ family protein
MGSSIAPSGFRYAILWSVVLLNVGGILLAGLNTKGFEFHNDVEWVSDGTGIEFGEHGLAYTDVFSTPKDSGSNVEPGFTIEIALRPDEGTARSFRFIAVVHSGDDASQLLIAQWRQTIIVMNGDDYDNRRRSPKLVAAISNYDAGPRFLVVRSDARGCTLYIDGKSVATSADFMLRLPTNDLPGRLVLGNSVYGDAPWRGTIAGFALHRVALNAETLQHHLESWYQDQGFVGKEYSSADLSYPLSERSGRRALDRSSNGRDLQFPSEVTFLDPRFFAGIDTSQLSDTMDVFTNLSGFIPLGFFLVALYAEANATTRLPGVAAAVALGFGLSLCIELAQAWIPSRSSSILDLLLNVVGAGVGAIAFVVVSRSKASVLQTPSPGNVEKEVSLREWRFWARRADRKVEHEEGPN